MCWNPQLPSEETLSFGGQLYDHWLSTGTSEGYSDGFRPAQAFLRWLVAWR